MIKYLSDAKVHLRFLRGDDAQHYPAARELFSVACVGKCVLIFTDFWIATWLPWLRHPATTWRRSTRTLTDLRM